MEKVFLFGFTIATSAFISLIKVCFLLSSTLLRAHQKYVAAVFDINKFSLKRKEKVLPRIYIYIVHGFQFVVG
jgi:hypothetical protein